MHVASVGAALEIFERTARRIVFAKVYPAGGDAVANHFAEVLRGHLYGRAFARFIYIPPIFEVVLIAAFVVQPSRRISEHHPLLYLRAHVTLIKPRSGEELRRAVFGEVVGEPLPYEARLEAIFAYL